MEMYTGAWLENLECFIRKFETLGWNNMFLQFLQIYSYQMKLKKYFNTLFSYVLWTFAVDSCILFYYL